MTDEPTGTVAGKSRARRGAFAAFAFLSRSLQQISAFVITLLAARFLVPADYGIYTLAVVFILLIQTLTYTGFYHFIVTSKAEDEAVLSTSFWMLTGLATMAAGLLALAAYPIGAAFKAPELAQVILWLAAFQPFAGVTAWFSAVLLRRQRVGAHFTVMFLQNFIALVGGIVLLWLWQSIYALVAFRGLRIVSAIVLYLIVCRDHPRLSFDKALARKAAGFSGGLYGSRFMAFLAQYSSDLLLGLTYSTAEAGLYRFGSRVASGASDIVMQPMVSFALTQFGAAARNDKPLENLLKRFVGAMVLLIGAVAAVIIVFGETVVANYFDPAYVAALTVTYAFAVHGIANTGVQLLTPVMSASDKTGILLVFNTISAAAVILVVLLATPFGLSAVAWSQAAATLVISCAAAELVRRKAGIGIGPVVRAFLLSLAIVALYGIVLWLCWSGLQTALGLSVHLELALGLALAVGLFVVMLGVGWKAGVFSLAVFSG